MDTIVFDLDDTLYDRSQPLEKAFINFYPAKKLTFEKFLPIFTKNSDLAFDQMKEGIVTLEESHIFRIKQTLHEMGIEITDNQARAFQSSYQSFQESIELYSSVIDILEFLREKEIQTLIITNGPSATQRTKFKNLGLASYFKQDEVIISEEVGIAKPDKRIFEAAEKRFHFAKNHAWYIGDSYPNDIMGASNAGWHTIWFNKNNKPYDHPGLPTKTVSSPLELKNYIFQAWG